MLYNIVVASTIHQHESVTGVLMPLPPESPSHLTPHSTPLGYHKALGWASCITQRFTLGNYFTYGNACVSMTLFQGILPSPSEVSQKEKGNYCILTSVWNLESWYWWNYLQGSNGDPDMRASLLTQLVKNLPATQETWVGKIPWRRAWQPTPVFLPGESTWTEEPGVAEVDTTEWRSTAVSNTVIHNFKSYTSFIVTIKYWLYVLYNVSL